VPHRWVKRGIVYSPDGTASWARSHAYLPTAYCIDEQTIRVYFASLDDQRRGRIGYVDLNSGDPRQIRDVSREPAFDVGPPGSFDDSGVTPSCAVRMANAVFLYYFGWHRMTTVPYSLQVGLAISRDGGRTFSRYSSAPVLGAASCEAFVRSAPCVMPESGGFTMWYVSGTGWIEIHGRSYPTYMIRRTRSRDGIHWETVSVPCLAPAGSDEFGFGRPWVMRDGGVYRMWYSIRSRSRPYHLGYAESPDGVQWARRDADVGIGPSQGREWDSDMLCFACVVDVGGRRYMFYNGNDHGRAGFGCAELLGD